MGCLDVVEHGHRVPLAITSVDCDGVSVVEGAAELRLTVRSGKVAVLSRTTSINAVPRSLGLPELEDAQLRVDAIDSSGRLIARGNSLHFAVPSTETVGVELFAVDRFTRLCRTLGNARAFHSATLLADGSVLVAGGEGPDGTLSSMELIRSAEIRDVGPLAISAQGRVFRFPRSHHAAVLTDSGQVVISGGEDERALLSSVLFVDPPSGFMIGAVGPSIPATMPRSRHAAFKFGSNVFLIGGRTTQTQPNPRLERLDLVSNRLEQVFALPEARLEAAMARLDSFAIIAGGLEGSVPTARVDLVPLDSITASRQLTLQTARHAATAIMRADRIMVAGGLGIDGGALGSTELISIDPLGVAPGPSISPRAGLCAASLHSGRTLLFGGAVAEVVRGDGSVVGVPFSGASRQGQACVSMDDESVLVIGGVDESGRPLGDIWRYVAGQ